MVARNSVVRARSSNAHAQRGWKVLKWVLHCIVCMDWHPEDVKHASIPGTTEPPVHPSAGPPSGPAETCRPRLDRHSM